MFEIYVYIILIGYKRKNYHMVSAFKVYCRDLGITLIKKIPIHLMVSGI
jgi:hypothetical protein